MIIAGKELLEEGILENLERSEIRSASCYLTTGVIIPSGASALEFSKEKSPVTLMLQPGEIAWVVSKEVINLKSRKDISGLLTLRSTLTKKGLLAIDTGIIDPGWWGPMKTMLVNVSNRRVTISTGEAFFRVLFFRHAEIDDEFLITPAAQTYDDFIVERHADVLESYDASFLSRHSQPEEQSEKLLHELSSWLLKRYWKWLFLLAATLPLILVALAGILYWYFFQDVNLEEMQEFIETYKALSGNEGS